ncbi:MAG: DNA-binding protein [Candidatus Micrarchaeia archaeon]
MKINELKAGANNVTITAIVSKKDDAREVTTKYGKRLQVANIVLKDETGEIAMSLWGNDINTVNVGDKVEVSNAYVNEFKGNPQLSTGKFGKIRVIEKGSGKAESEDESAPTGESEGEFEDV